MFKKDMFKGIDSKNFLQKIKSKSTPILFAVVIILLLILHFERTAKIEDLANTLGRTEGEVKSAKMLLGKQLNDMDDQIKSISSVSQKTYESNEEQAKILSIIPTDNAFFKKWLMSNHQETLKSIQEVRNSLDELKSELSGIKEAIDNISTSKGNTAGPVQKNTVETISI
jgi:exopolysaccharide biosynthesis protein